MNATQLTQGGKTRLMYVENKNGEIDGHRARIGWVKFSKTGCSVYYRGLTLRKVRGGGVRGNFRNAATEEEFWISGVKQRGSNAHWAESAADIHVDEDAIKAYRSMREARNQPG